MPQHITEAQDLTVTQASTPGRVLLQLITPGWGSSGYYSAPVLENAAADKVWPAGTHAYFDHPSESEDRDRPERSVRDLVMVLAEDAYVGEGGGLVAEANVIGPYRDLVTDPVFMEAVGMSIRASADRTIGEAEGRKGMIVTQLVEGISVDIVTHAGRGGRILAAVESARRAATEAASNEVSQALDVAVRDRDPQAWLVDFDPEAGLAYVRSYADEQSHVMRHPYTYTAPNAVIDWGDSTEVRPITSYVPTGEANEAEPHNPPVSPAGFNEESEEDTMPQIEESRLAQLEADAGRATTAESERTAAVERAEAAEAALARHERRESIRQVIESVEGSTSLNALERAGIEAGHMDGELDEDALRGVVESAVAEREATVAESKPFGFGGTAVATGDDDTIKAAESAVAGAFGRTVKEA